MTRAKREVLVKQSTDAERWTVNLEEPGSPLHGIPVYRPLRKISTCLPSRPLLTPSPPIFIDWLYSNLMLKILISCAGSIYAARLACTCSLYILRELFRLPQIWLSIIIIECNNQNHYKGKPTGWEAGKMKRRVIHWKGIIMIRTPDTSFLPKLFAWLSHQVKWTERDEDWPNLPSRYWMTPRREGKVYICWLTNQIGYGWGWIVRLSLELSWSP